MSDKLRIAFVADAINAGLGGAVVAARYVVDKLKEQHEVVLIGADVRGAGSVTMQGFQLPIRAMRDNEFVMAVPNREALAAAIAKVDVVHLQFPFWLSFAALAAARKLGRPVVAAFHVQPENALLNIGIRAHSVSQIVYDAWVKRFYNRADAVICPSAFAQKRLIQHGLVTPSFVISNGLPPDIKPATHVREPGHEDEFTVLMVGRLSPEKRQEDLVEAVRRSKHSDRIRLIIAGAGPREHELQRLSRSLPNGAEIGFVPRNRLRKLLSWADLFVHCSEVELEGIAVIEALGTGLPALVAKSEESAAADLAIDGDFRFPAGDPEALANKLDRLIDDPGKLAAARIAAREIGESHGLDRSVQQITATYRFVVRRAHSHAA
jgi:glycosyltransferase involved in cell wall biosynthesis